MTPFEATDMNLGVVFIYNYQLFDKSTMKMVKHAGKSSFTVTL
jgi:hypothetical protein